MFLNRKYMFTWELFNFIFQYFIQILSNYSFLYSQRRSGISLSKIFFIKNTGLDMEVLVPRGWKTGPWMWKYWSLDVEVLVPGCVKLGLEMLPENVRNIYEKTQNSRLFVLTKLLLVINDEFLVESLFNIKKKLPRFNQILFAKLQFFWITTVWKKYKSAECKFVTFFVPEHCSKPQWSPSIHPQSPNKSYSLD